MSPLLTPKELEKAKRAAQAMGGGEDALALAQEEILNTRIVHALISARLSAKISGAETAKRMGVSPSKISRLESAYDSELSWGDIRDYAKAVGLNISMIFDPAGDVATRIKHCVLEIGQQLRHLAGLAEEAKADETLTKGIDRFHKETLFDFLLQFDSSYRSLPRIETAPLPTCSLRKKGVKTRGSKRERKHSTH